MFIKLFSFEALIICFVCAAQDQVMSSSTTSFINAQHYRASCQLKWAAALRESFEKRVNHDIKQRDAFAEGTPALRLANTRLNRLVEEIKALNDWGRRLQAYVDRFPLNGQILEPNAITACGNPANVERFINAAVFAGVPLPFTALCVFDVAIPGQDPEAKYQGVCPCQWRGNEAKDPFADMPPLERPRQRRARSRSPEAPRSPPIVVVDSEDDADDDDLECSETEVEETTEEEKGPLQVGPCILCDLSGDEARAAHEGLKLASCDHFLCFNCVESLERRSRYAKCPLCRARIIHQYE